jgi:hypothetical protein
MFGLYSLLLLLISTLVYSKIAFVNEVCRHGARAPFLDESDTRFPNGDGMLTASGMRQHYLLGKQLATRYVSTEGEEKLLSEEFDPEEIYVRSTQVKRTIQSAESQILGLYGLDQGLQLQSDQIEKALPHVNITDKDEILKQLGKDAIEGRYRPIPIHNYPREHELIADYADCPYVMNDQNSRRHDPEVWKPFEDHYRPLIFQQLADIMNETIDEITFNEANYISDILWSEDFEGLPKRYNFTTEEWTYVKEIQLIHLQQQLSDTSNKIMISRMINPIIEMMKRKIGMPPQHHSNPRFPRYQIPLLLNPRFPAIPNPTIPKTRKHLTKMGRLHGGYMERSSKIKRGYVIENSKIRITKPRLLFILNHVPCNPYYASIVLYELHFSDTKKN